MLYLGNYAVNTGGLPFPHSDKASQTCSKTRSKILGSIRQRFVVVVVVVVIIIDHPGRLIDQRAVAVDGVAIIVGRILAEVIPLEPLFLQKLDQISALVLVFGNVEARIPARGEQVDGRPVSKQQFDHVEMALVAGDVQRAHSSDFQAVDLDAWEFEKDFRAFQIALVRNVVQRGHQLVVFYRVIAAKSGDQSRDNLRMIVQHSILEEN